MVKRILTFLVVIVVLPIMMSGCLSGREYRFEHHPTSQPNTTWETEDKRVRFTCDANGLTEGCLETTEGIVNIRFGICPQTTDVLLSTSDDALDGVIEGFAKGTDKVISENEYSITISYADLYFDKGMNLVFYKVNETVDDSLS